MTPEQRQTLHRILLDAKAEIKDGKLYDHNHEICESICLYVFYHYMGGYTLSEYCENLYIRSAFYRNDEEFVAPAFDFSHPDRLALLDWLINETKP